MPPPVREGQHQGGQQYIIDATMECGRHRGQQWTGDRRRQGDSKMAGGVDRVSIWIERPLGQGRIWRAQHRSPEREFCAACWILRMLRKTLSPTAE